MKTAVSLPEDLFLEAEATAKKLRVSRSQLYATAIAEFLARNQSEKVTGRLNEIYATTPARVDPALHSAQIQSLDQESW